MRSFRLRLVSPLSSDLMDKEALEELRQEKTRELEAGKKEIKKLVRRSE